MHMARLQTGQEIIVDDYREAYFWLRDHTPADARVMAWWDYGYQITGIGNRTTIADGNTWNHEHIATGKILSAPEDEAQDRSPPGRLHSRSGGRLGDDLQSPHMARIGNSVFLDICPDDPTCSKFGFYQGDPHADDGEVPALQDGAVWYETGRLDGASPARTAPSLTPAPPATGRPGVELDPNRWQHAYTSGQARCASSR